MHSLISRICSYTTPYFVYGSSKRNHWCDKHLWALFLSTFWLDDHVDYARNKHWKTQLRLRKPICILLISVKFMVYRSSSLSYLYDAHDCLGSKGAVQKNKFPIFQKTAVREIANVSYSYAQAHLSIYKHSWQMWYSWAARNFYVHSYTIKKVVTGSWIWITALNIDYPVQ